MYMVFLLRVWCPGLHNAEPWCGGGRGRGRGGGGGGEGSDRQGKEIRDKHVLHGEQRSEVRNARSNVMTTRQETGIDAEPDVSSNVPLVKASPLQVIHNDDDRKGNFNDYDVHLREEGKDDHDEDDGYEYDDDGENIITFTVRKFPGNKYIKDNSGLPWGCTLRPLAMNGCKSGRQLKSKNSSNENIDNENGTSSQDADRCSVDELLPFMRSDLVPRCTDCYGYLCRPCYVDRWGWRCCLCGCYNTFPTSLHSHLNDHGQNRNKLKRFERVGRCELYEMQNNVTELEVSRRAVSFDIDEENGRVLDIRSLASEEGTECTTTSWQAHAHLGYVPLTLFLIDANITSDKIYDLMVSSLSASLDALDQLSFVGIILIVNDELHILDIQSAGQNCFPPCQVRRYPLTSLARTKVTSAMRPKSNDNDGATILNSFGIEDCMNLESIIAMVGNVKLSLVKTLKHLHSSIVSKTKNRTGSCRRNVGSAITAILQLLENGICEDRQDCDSDINENEEYVSRYIDARLILIMFGAPSGPVGAVDDDMVRNATKEIKPFQNNTTNEQLNEDSTKSFQSKDSRSTHDKYFEGDLIEKVIIEEEVELFQSHEESKSGMFYNSVGKWAASIGVTCDCFLVCSKVDVYFDIASFQALPELSGGTLMYYYCDSGIPVGVNQGELSCSLPVDLHKYLSLSQKHSATNCSLRLRTSNEYRINEHFGYMNIDDRSNEYDTSSHIYKSPRCTVWNCYTFGFDFNSLHGFNDEGASRDNSYNSISRSQYSLPLLQIAFEYDLYTPQYSKVSDENTSSMSGNIASRVGKHEESPSTRYVSTRWVHVKRLRIMTVQNDVCWSLTSPTESIYNYIDAPSTVVVLFHKAIRQQRKKGSIESKNLLRDWLIVLVARYYNNCGIHVERRLADLSEEDRKMYNANGECILNEVDTSFKSERRIRALSRLIFGLLKNDILNIECMLDEISKDSQTIHVSDIDAALAAVFLLSSVSNERMAIEYFLYPSLTSFADNNNVLKPRHALNRRSIVESNGNIFLLDAGDKIYVYCTQQYYFKLQSPDTNINFATMFPPPENCLLKKTINFLARSRIRTPSVHYFIGGINSVKEFERKLIEEKVDSSGGQKYQKGRNYDDYYLNGFLNFTDHVEQEAANYIQAHLSKE